MTSFWSGFWSAPVRSLCASSTRRADSRSCGRTGGKQGEEQRRTGPLLSAAAGWGGQHTKPGADPCRHTDPDPNANYDSTR